MDPKTVHVIATEIVYSSLYKKGIALDPQKINKIISHWHDLTGIPSKKLLEFYQVFAEEAFRLFPNCIRDAEILAKEPTP